MAAGYVVAAEHRLTMNSHAAMSDFSQFMGMLWWQILNATVEQHLHYRTRATQVDRLCLHCEGFFSQGIAKRLPSHCNHLHFSELITCRATSMRPGSPFRYTIEVLRRPHAKLKHVPGPRSTAIKNAR